MISFKVFIIEGGDTLSPQHKQAIARGRRGSRHSSTTKLKIAKSMEGKKNFEGEEHTERSKDLIGAKRGSADRIKGRRWIVNRRGKTYRKYQAPVGYKLGKREFNRR
jgi:hypothetical protein